MTTPETPAALGPQHRVVRARAEHVPAIVALLADDPLGGSREDPSDPAYVRAFRAIDADPAHVLVVVLDTADQVVGTLQLTFLPSLSRRGMLRAQVEGVRVAGGARGGGLGEALLRWAIEHARERGAGLVQLTIDKSRGRAHALYERLGFVASHEGMKLPLR